MFERFAHDAREAVVHAQDEARSLGADHIRTEHVLLGAVRAPDAVATRALLRLGVDGAALLAAVRALPSDAIDADALAGVGIDLDAVRAQVEASFGPGALDGPGAPRTTAGHLPFDADAKKMLELALREAIRFRHRRIDTGHLLLAAVRVDGSGAYRALASAGAGVEAVREAVAAVWADVPVG
ncbi:Clp protease N-terminal domain-containing protein [Cellulomonas sp. ICMP 17802]|uniref:Clp protease N-terminal domain-containing protein n=1 Tax=Cellulomonas sp. ICMP 17802 TaxID=3239199 RepID=UPI00351B74AC